MTVHYPARKNITHPYFTCSMSWTPDGGISVKVPQQTLNWDSTNRFTNYASTTLLAEMSKFESEQQSNYFNFRDRGFTLVDSPQGKVWIFEGTSLEAFGTPYLKWNAGNGRGGYSGYSHQRNGEWTLFLNGIEEVYSNLGSAPWNDENALEGITQKAQLGDLLLIELTMLHPEKIRHATDLWEQSHAAAAVTELVRNARKESHTPYTKIAKLLRDANVVNTNNNWRRLRVYPIYLPNTSVVPAVLIRSNDSHPSSVTEVLESNGFGIVNVDWTQMLGYRSGHHALWAKNPSLFENDNPRFKEWVVTQVPHITTRSHAKSALV